MKINVKGIKLTKSQKELWKFANDNETKYILANWSRQSRQINYSIIALHPVVNTKGTRNNIYYTNIFIGKENIFKCH